MTRLLKAMCVAVALYECSHSASAGVDTDEFKRSVWDTQYESMGGDLISATVFLNGDSGHYDTAYGSGRLSRITYRFDEVDGEYKATVHGRWAMDNMSGEFRFVSSSFLEPQQWNGDWSMNGQRRGRWTGRLRSVAQGSATPTGFSQNGFGQTSCQTRTLQSNVSTPVRGGTYSDWSWHSAKGYHYRTCLLPAGGCQYLISYPDNPDWTYWYNPSSKVFWCACPTVNHPTYGCQIQGGHNLFLMASSKASTIDATVFPDPGVNGANFKRSMTATDSSGVTVALNPPPADLP
ncbi:MAG: hypothetical protein ACK58L_01675 [Planctomycetota bacterium]